MTLRVEYVFYQRGQTWVADLTLHPTPTTAYLLRGLPSDQLASLARQAHAIAAGLKQRNAKSNTRPGKEVT